MLARAVGTLSFPANVTLRNALGKPNAKPQRNPRFGRANTDRLREVVPGA
jgi:hypothetical protein